MIGNECLQFNLSLVRRPLSIVATEFCSIVVTGYYYSKPILAYDQDQRLESCAIGCDLFDADVPWRLNNRPTVLPYYFVGINDSWVLLKRSK